MKITKYSAAFIECFLIVFLIYMAFFVHKNVSVNSASIRNQFHLAVFLRQGEPSPEVIAEKIRALENFNHLEFISKDRLKSVMTEVKNDVIISGENPFPDTFKVTPGKFTSSAAENLSHEIQRIKGIDEVRYDSKMVKVIDALDVSEKALILVLKLITVLVFLHTISAVIGFRKRGGGLLAGSLQSRGSGAGIPDFVSLVWRIGGTLAGIMFFEAFYILKLKNTLIDLTPGKIFIVFIIGGLFSLSKALNSTESSYED